MSKDSLFNIEVESIENKVAELSVSYGDSDRSQLSLEIDSTGSIKNHMLDIINQAPELLESHGDIDANKYNAFAQSLASESEAHIKKELGLTAYQWTPEELGFNFFNKQTENGIETVVEKNVHIPSLEGEFPIQFAMKDRYEFEVVDTAPDLLSKTFGEDADIIKQEALDSFEKDKAEITMKLIENEYRDRNGVSNDAMYLKHIEMDTMPTISNLEVVDKYNVVRADVSSSFVIVDEHNGKNIKSDFSKDTEIELPIVAVSGSYEIDYNSEKYKQDIKSYMDSFKSQGSLSYDMVNKVADKKENNDFILLSSIESKMVEDGIKPEASKQKKSKSLGMSM